jgi:hypothetical protein
VPPGALGAAMVSLVAALTDERPAVRLEAARSSRLS